MAGKPLRASRIIIFDSRQNQPPLRVSKRPESRTPSPESIMLVNSKLDLFNSFKNSFQRSKTKSKFLTPLPTNKIPVPNINITNLNIKHYGLGDNRAQLLSTAIKSMERLQSINIKGTGVTEVGSSCILHSINSENIRVIDMSSNVLGAVGISSLCEMLSNTASNLETLNLENVKLNLKHLASICVALKSNRTLKTLNLANNAIGMGSGMLLADMLEENRTIETLDLQWNFIKGMDVVLIGRALRGNVRICTLDLSWNSIGHDRVHESAVRLFQSLSGSESLMHLDISHNNFSMADSKVIAEIIKGNRRIRGIHYEGNYGWVDPLGFLQPVSYVSINKAGRRSVRICGKPAKCYENCWICNTWSDVQLQWDPQRIVWNRRLRHFALAKLSTQIEPIYIHLETDDYKPFLLSQSSSVYSCTRALPLGKLRFFFSYRGVAQISNEYPLEVCDPPIKQLCHFYKGFSKELMAVIVNYIVNDSQVLNFEPRPQIDEYEPPPGDVPEPDIPVWSLETSIFANFFQATAEIYDKCFETDWANSKVAKFVKAEVAKNACKELARREYQKIYFTYKYLAGLSSNNGLFSVSLNILTDLCQRKGIFDKNFKMSDLDLNIKACTTASTSTQFNNGFSLVRHEFLELQIRIALDKYLRTGMCKTEEESLEVYLRNAVFSTIRPYEWRINRLFNEECDVVLVGNKELLSAIYEGAKGRASKNSEKKGICEEDFMFVMQENGFFNERFTSRYGHICFHLALNMRVDEISSMSFMLAGFYEFVEAFCRVCDMTDSQDVEKDIVVGFCNPDVTLDKKIEKGLNCFSYVKGKRSRR